MSNPIIDCAVHDYVEIACMYGFDLTLKLDDESTCQGKALDVTIDNNRDECLVIEEKGKTLQVVLNRVKSMKVINENPHFEIVDF
ncbi:hypothetical protein FLL45_18185 [Aliikangiella marina]|uniref:Uncharacterized protein n=1 Tax=Aliikangiella marina TaxID=1712262 RepID=A0A545T4J9_9GAMM|nr:Rho-binding antiterminator [Aliikangiella marina]TQV72150.1 hypothetical protein FLL45_18185 [Aliikangiella marina]